MKVKVAILKISAFRVTTCFHVITCDILIILHGLSIATLHLLVALLLGSPLLLLSGGLPLAHLHMAAFEIGCASRPEPVHTRRCGVALSP